MTIAERLRELDRRVIARAERRLAPAGPDDAWYGGRRLRLLIGVLALVGGVYDVVVVAVGVAPLVTMTGAPLLLFVGARFTRSAVAEAPRDRGR